MLTLKCQQSPPLFLFNAITSKGGMLVGDWRLCRKAVLVLSNSVCQVVVFHSVPYWALFVFDFLFFSP